LDPRTARPTNVVLVLVVVVVVGVLDVIRFSKH